MRPLSLSLACSSAQGTDSRSFHRSLQDNQALLLTPFERNLEVWRQLWRTLERSDLIVQIVDARNPLTFRSEDLERYVLELNGPKGDDDDDEESEGEDVDDKGEGTSKKPKPRRQNLLLINKSDLLTRGQRCVARPSPLSWARSSVELTRPSFVSQGALGRLL